MAIFLTSGKQWRSDHRTHLLGEIWCFQENQRPDTLVPLTFLDAEIGNTAESSEVRGLA
jgi:hypothetical protein